MIDYSLIIMTYITEPKQSLQCSIKIDPDQKIAHFQGVGFVVISLCNCIDGSLILETIQIMLSFASYDFPVAMQCSPKWSHMITNKYVTVTEKRDLVAQNKKNRAFDACGLIQPSPMFG